MQSSKISTLFCVIYGYVGKFYYSSNLWDSNYDEVSDLHPHRHSDFVNITLHNILKKLEFLSSSPICMERSGVYISEDAGALMQ